MPRRPLPTLALLLVFAAALAWLVLGAPRELIVDGAPGPHEKQGAEHEDLLAHQYPSDFFYARRANPDGTFPQDEYLAALDQLSFERATSLQTSAGVAWQPVGPYNVGGRVTALAVAPGATTLYLGSANGGVWKSTDSGVSWTPVTDRTPIVSVGALALDPTDPNVLWCGTGESNGSVDSYDGVGVWRSRDGGATWQNRGLTTTGRISSVAVDPLDPRIVYAGAMGRQFSTGPDRGLYRSADGGATWTRVLFVSDSTGVCDLAVNPVHPETVFCATWERVRRNTYRRAYGAECGVWRSVDRGLTWTRLAGGLPAGENVGRIGLAMAPSQPATVYAQVVSGLAGGYTGLGMWRTDDGGTTWTQRNVDATFTNAFGGFGWYFGEVAVEPTNPERVYAMGVSLLRSDDGGATWADLTGAMHVDQHAIWLDPADPAHLYAGNDGGFWWSTDGVTFDQSLGLPITQFYDGDVDATNPAIVFGGAQDNGTNRTNAGPFAWTPSLGGDGFHVGVDPTTPSVVFAEWQWCSDKTGLKRSTNGGTSFSSTSGWTGSDRFGWDAPFTFNPRSHNTLLAGSQYVYRSLNNGRNWSKISPDLSANIPSALTFGSVTTLDVSKPDTNVYYAGTDDARVWRTLNRGGAWTEISAGLPKRWISRVVADPADAQVVYVTQSGYASDVPTAFVWRSTDRGATWTNIAGNLPAVPVNDLVVDPLDTNRLYLATDLGVWTTRNLGATWYELGAGLPLGVVADLVLHAASRRLFAFTHGRSAWSLDLAALPVSTPETAAGNALQLGVPRPNPAREGARIALELPRAGVAQVVIYDVLGRRVATLHEGALGAGRHEFAWSRRDAHGTRAAAGVYFVRAASQGATRVRRLVVAD
ncbi:MAG: FlgD immunoglobulin-like domain containing protein [Candidatus Eisenbacteria bacterium]